MATGTAPAGPQSPGGPPRQRSDTERLIEQRLEQTQRQVKWVDLATGAVALTAGVLAYLLVATVLDHWVLPGGLGRGGRVLLWAVLTAGAGWYFVREILPAILYRVSPVFAAYTIEKARPSFKNSLINLLFLRRQRSDVERDDLARRVYEGLEARTARDLSQAGPETPVDRTRLIHLGYVLLLLVAVCCLYLAILPKNLLASFGRVAWPWSDAPAPTRVQFRNVEPGTATAYQGDTLVVSAEVRGLRGNEGVTLHYTTADGQFDETIPMAVPEGGFRYQCELPPGQLGFKQSLDYYLSAGDGRAGPYRVDVQTPLTITVDRVDYEYPKYTGLAPRTLERLGEAQAIEADLKGIEGTRVTLRAQASHPIQHAAMELNCDPRYPRPMTASGQTAQVALALRMSREDPTQPEFHSYHLRFTDPQNRPNRRPIRHRIAVLPDLKPEVKLIQPPPEEVQLPLGGRLDLRLRAEDPDYGLRRVGIRAQREGKSLDLRPVLEKSKPEKAHRGPFEGVYCFKPAEVQLKPGDRIEYWGEAEDNKEDQSGPAPNRAETEKRWVVIVADDARQQPNDGQAKGKPQPDGQEGNPEGQQAERPQPGDAKDRPGANQGQPKQEPKQNPSKDPQGGVGQQDQADPGNQDQAPPQNPEGQQGNAGGGNQGGASKQQGGKNQGQSSPDMKNQGGSPNEDRRGPVDPTANAGDAMREILKDREQQKQEQGKADAGQQPQGDQQGNKEQPAPKQQPGKEKPAPGKQQGGGDQAKEQQGDSQGEPSERGPPQGGAKSDPRKQGRPPGAEPKGQEDPSDQEAGSQDQPGGKGRRGDPKTSAGKKPPAGQEDPGDPQGGEDQEGTKGEKGTAKSKGKPKAGEPAPSEETGESGEETAGPKEPSKAKPGGSKGAKQQPSTTDQPQDGDPTEGEGKAEADPRKSGGKDAPGKEHAKGKPPGEAGAKQGDPQADPDNPQNADQAEPGQKTPGSKGSRSQGPSDPKQEKEKPSGQGQERPDAQGGDPEENQGAAGKGQKGADDKGGPSPQAGNQPRKMSPDKPETQSGKSDEPQSPGTSEKQSDSKGRQGDKSGGGGQGGGQKAEQQGTGNPGAKTSAEQGAGKSEEQGEGETGAKAGQHAKSDQATSKSGPKEKGQGAGKGQPGGQKAEQRPDGKEKGPSPDEPGKSEQPPGSEPGGNQSSKTGSAAAGNPDRGGVPGDAPPPSAAQEPARLGGEDPNLDYSKKQTTLALRHLQEEMAKDQSELLERLGWSRQDAEKFLRQWQEMMKTAQKPGPRGQAAKEELDAALKSLGLRRGSTSLKSKQSGGDALQNLRDPGRFPPPPKWRDRFRAYTEGVGSRKE